MPPVPIRQYRQLVLFAILILGMSTGCGGTSDEPIDDQPHPPPEYANSGRLLSGVYEGNDGNSPVKFTFTSEGLWTRVATKGSSMESTSGSYLVDKENRLVLYLEMVGDGQLATAVESVYGLEGDPATSISITDGAGRTVSLTRTGDEPAVKPAS